MGTRRMFRYASSLAAPCLVLTLTAGACNGEINAPPTADAGDDHSAVVGELITLDGSGSSDPDGDPLTFSWELEERPSESAAALEDADTATPRFSPDVAGAYLATLTVSDGEHEASDSVTVTATGPGTPVADAGDDQSVEVGALVTLDGSGSSDPDGDPLTFAWELEETPAESAATLDGADTPTPTFTADAAGHYLATLTVSDGDLVASDSTTVTASDGSNQPPSLSEIDAQRTPMNEPVEVPVTVVDEDPESVVLEASSDDQSLVNDGDIDALGTGKERALRITPAPLGRGQVTISVTAADADGLEANESFRLEVTRPFQTQLPKLTASDAAEGDRFGWAVAISGDQAVIGAQFADDDGTDSGSAYVFHRSDDEWVQSTTLPPDPPVVAPTANVVSAGDEFGRAVAIDGNYVLVGAPYDDEQATDAGAAFLYERCVSTTFICQQPWSEAGKLTADDAATGDRFGYSVAISGDYALVGAPGVDDDGTDAGSAYVFQRSGDTWTQGPKLTADDAAEGDWFGRSVALDGDYALIAAPFDDDDGNRSGSAYVFQRSGDAWNHKPKLTASDAAPGAEFGWSVAIRGDRALVGAPSHYDDDTPDTGYGSAYVFQRSGDLWSESGRLTTDDVFVDVFGSSVGIDGDVALVGARRADVGTSDTGAAYVFQRSGGTWHETATVTASDAADLDWFGASVALEGDHAVVGAPFDDDDGDGSGSAYVFLK